MQLLFPWLLFFVTTTSAFNSNVADSLQAQLNKTPADTLHIQSCINQLRHLGPADTIKSNVLFKWIDAHTNHNALLYLKADALLAMGRMHTLASRYVTATHYLTIAQALAEKHNIPIVLAQALNILGSIYQNNNQHDKAAQFFSRSILISKENNYTPGVIKARYNLGKLKFENDNLLQNNKGNGLQDMLAAFNMALTQKDTQSIVNQSMGIAYAYSRLQKPAQSIYYLNIAANVLKFFGKEEDYISLYYNLGNNYSTQNNFDKAIAYYKTGLLIAEKNNTPRWMCNYYTGLAEVYEEMHNYRMANYYNQLNIHMHNSMDRSESFAAAADIQNRYERTKKDNAILKLEAINKRKSFTNSMLLGATVAVICISILLLLNYKKSQKIARQDRFLHTQKIVELEKNRQLMAVDAMLKGQEEERGRIAKELHDGLGGLLTGTKYSLMNLKEILPLDAEKMLQFEKALCLLDNTIADARKIAHNLMPEILLAYGLIEAVRDYCSVMQSSTGVNIVYQSYGEERLLNANTESFAYRIVQELINNAIKHSGATEIFVQTICRISKIEISVEDNGCGFDKSILQNKKGAGMRNIEYRVEYFNGFFEIDTAPGKGAAFNVKLVA